MAADGAHIIDPLEWRTQRLERQFDQFDARLRNTEVELSGMNAKLDTIASSVSNIEKRQTEKDDQRFNVVQGFVVSTVLIVLTILGTAVMEHLWSVKQ